jgi:hypothetical protein
MQDASQHRTGFHDGTRGASDMPVGKISFRTMFTTIKGSFRSRKHPLPVDAIAARVAIEMK